LSNFTYYLCGGAIYFNINNNFATILNTDFINNSGSNGGAIYFGTFNPGTVLTNVLFQSNNCSESGGAMYFLTNNSGVQFYNVTFQSNTALMTGGAIHFEINNGIKFYATSNNQIEISSSKFSFNNAVQHGGAIYSAQGNKLVIKDTEFMGNKALYGGAIMIIGKTNLTFTGKNDMKWNNATLGGTLYMTRSYLYTGVAPNMLTIANNSAERGSGIYMDLIDFINNQNNHLTSVTFIDNYASVGGTIFWIYDSNSGMMKGPNIDDVIFTNNEANYGIEIATQGLEIYGPSSYEVTVYNKPFEVVDF
jgi:predicted outer membrane repeat protein